MEIYESLREYMKKRKGGKVSVPSVMNWCSCTYRDACGILDQAVRDGYLLYAGGMEYSVMSSRGGVRHTMVRDGNGSRIKSARAQARDTVCGMLRKGPCTVPQLMEAAGLTYMEMQDILKGLHDRCLAECTDGMEWKAAGSLARPARRHDPGWRRYMAEEEKATEPDEPAEVEIVEEPEGVEVFFAASRKSANVILSYNGAIQTIARNLQCFVNHPERIGSFLEAVGNIQDLLKDLHNVASTLYGRLSSIQGGPEQLHTATENCRELCNEAGDRAGAMHNVLASPDLAKATDVQAADFQKLDSRCNALYESIIRLTFIK